MNLFHVFELSKIFKYLHYIWKEGQRGPFKFSKNLEVSLVKLLSQKNVHRIFPFFKSENYFLLKVQSTQSNSKIVKIVNHRFKGETITN